MNKKSKPVSYSAIHDHSYRIFPNDLNSHGTLFGGTVMSICDRVASVVAERHCEMACVTVSCDSFNFLKPAGRGDILVFKSSVNRTWTSSMEIGVKVIAENYRIHTCKHVVSAYFTFVGLNEENRPTAIPSVIPESRKEKRRYEEADKRRSLRLN